MSTAVPQFKGTLTDLVWDGRVMAITVEDFDVADESSAAEGSSPGSESKNDEHGGVMSLFRTFRTTFGQGCISRWVRVMSVLNLWKRNRWLSGGGQVKKGIPSSLSSWMMIRSCMEESKV